MAKSAKPSGMSRIKLIVLDAEVADDQIHTLTQALTNALRGPSPAPQLRRMPAAPQLNGGGEPDQEEMDFEEAEDEIDVVPQKKPRASSPRKAPKAPDIVDIDMDSDVSLADFAKGKDSSSQHKKYMIAAAWLKEHRATDGVTPGHIYTCFRSMDWPYNIPDFGQPLRDLKSKKYFVKNDKSEYEINHIGLGFVKKLGGSNGAD